MLLLQEFDFEEHRKSCENQVANYLSRLDNKDNKMEDLEIDDLFPDKKVCASTLDLIPLFVNFTNYLENNIIPEDLRYQWRKLLLYDMKRYFGDEPHFFSVYS